MAELTSVELILVDGANGITRAPREGFPLAAVFLWGAVGVVWVALGVKRRPWFRAVLASLASLPGWWQLTVVRADAPFSRPAAAAVLGESLQALQHAVAWPAPATIEEKSDVLFPLARYAAPTRSVGHVVQLVGEAAQVRCRSEEGLTRCGP